MMIFPTEVSIFLQDQGNFGIERRRTIKYAAQHNLKIDAEIAEKGSFML
jgi:hypothetical protein